MSFRIRIRVSKRLTCPRIARDAAKAGLYTVKEKVMCGEGRLRAVWEVGSLLQVREYRESQAKKSAKYLSRREGGTSSPEGSTPTRGAIGDGQVYL